MITNFNSVKDCLQTKQYALHSHSGFDPLIVGCRKCLCSACWTHWPFRSRRDVSRNFQEDMLASPSFQQQRAHLRGRNFNVFNKLHGFYEQIFFNYDNWWSKKFINTRSVSCYVMSSSNCKKKLTIFLQYEELMT